MSGFNQVILMGHAGKDADMSYTSSGTAVTRFSLAVNEYVGKDSNGNPSYKTQWFNILVWGNYAEGINKLVKKGGEYLVSGRLNIREYTAKDGSKGTSVEVIATQVTPCGKAPGNGNGHAAPATSGKPTSVDLDLGNLDDDPF